MKYDNDQLFEKVLEVIAGDRHRYYEEVCEKATHYNRIMTGEDQDSLIIQYKLRETDEQKEQRINITNSRTQYVSNKVLTVFDEVKRVDNVVDEIKWKDKEDPQDNTEKINNALKIFYDRQPLKKYLFEAIKHYQFYDPNAFIVVEMRENEEGVFAYPLEVTSKQAVNYEYNFGELEFLIVKHNWFIREDPDKEGKFDPANHKNQGSRYLLYAADIAIDFKQAGKYDQAEEGYDLIEGVQGEDTDEKLSFFYQVYETMSKVNPAIQVGYLRDPDTSRLTYVSPLEPAMKIIDDLINTKSEYDLSKALHGFIQKYAYAMKCDFEDRTETTRVACHGGKLNTTGEDCHVCNGTGLVVHKTVQDVILIKAPDGKEDHIPLDQMVYYVQIPEYIIERQKGDLKDLERDVSLAIFNSNVFDRSEIAVTATEKRLNLRAVYNVLSDYGDQWSQVYKHCVNLTATYLGIEAGMYVQHAFPQDFNMETVEELIAQRKLAIDAQLPSHIIENLDLKILKKQSQDDPTRVLWQRAIDQHRPFADKTLQEKMFTLSLLDNEDPLKILYVHFAEIMHEVVVKYPEFYRMKYDARKTIVDEITQGYEISQKPQETPPGSVEGEEGDED